MDRNVLLRCQYTRWMLAIGLPHLGRADVRWMAMAGWMFSTLMILMVAIGAMPSEEGEVVLDAFRQGIIQAHPEWPPDVRAAALAGIICAGMPADMVRLAWGSPTHVSDSNGPGQPVTWHYAGRPSVLERLAGWGPHDPGSSEWQVSFIDGQVVAWTD